jgi:hypothetical protein
MYIYMNQNYQAVYGFKAGLQILNCNKYFSGLFIIHSLAFFSVDILLKRLEGQKCVGHTNNWGSLLCMVFLLTIFF